MDHYYKERFHVQQDLIKKIAPLTETGEIIEAVREQLRSLIPNAMEVCVLLLDPDAAEYTSPLQCALYDRPVSCQSCKRDRPAVQQAITRKKAVVVADSDPIVRPDGSRMTVGPEYAMPVFVENRILAIVSVVIQPLTRYTRRDFHLIRDFANVLGTILLTARRQWEITREKIRISQTLASLTPFVPGSVRRMADKNPDLLTREKETKQVSVLFIDLEGYTGLSATRPEAQVNAVIEKMFSSFVDPIHRSHGEINETSGDGFMIIFKDHEPKTNAMNAVKAAFEIASRCRSVSLSLAGELDVPDMGPMTVNMGISSGTALVGMTRFKGMLDTRMTFTASGAVTNIAARLSDHATGGDILISQGTKDLIHGLWPVYDRGKAKMKGISEPVQVYSLLKPA
ncbi:MAG: GAF domain-containing protein [Desulfotignum sp.]|nr:GAF domain-containing protein [Desulfotignum sp.]MCF8086599.1 GAF domain-containing protein [Desulfotignum sp.]MCF8136205.1 GAF domain-containing protein [Desulfotignum sp.]